MEVLIKILAFLFYVNGKCLIETDEVVFIFNDEMRFPLNLPSQYITGKTTLISDYTRFEVFGDFAVKKIEADCINGETIYSKFNKRIEKLVHIYSFGYFCRVPNQIAKKLIDAAVIDDILYMKNGISKEITCKGKKYTVHCDYILIYRDSDNFIVFDTTMVENCTQCVFNFGESRKKIYLDETGSLTCPSTLVSFYTEDEESVNEKRPYFSSLQYNCGRGGVLEIENKGSKLAGKSFGFAHLAGRGFGCAHLAGRGFGCAHLPMRCKLDLISPLVNKDIFYSKKDESFLVDCRLRKGVSLLLRCVNGQFKYIPVHRKSTYPDGVNPEEICAKFCIVKFNNAVYRYEFENGSQFVANCKSNYEYLIFDGTVKYWSKDGKLLKDGSCYSESLLYTCDSPASEIAHHDWKTDMEREGLCRVDDRFLSFDNDCKFVDWNFRGKASCRNKPEIEFVAYCSGKNKKMEMIFKNRFNKFISRERMLQACFGYGEQVKFPRKRTVGIHLAISIMLLSLAVYSVIMRN